VSIKDTSDLLPPCPSYLGPIGIPASGERASSAASVGCSRIPQRDSAWSLLPRAPRCLRLATEMTRIAELIFLGDWSVSWNPRCLATHERDSVCAPIRACGLPARRQHAALQRV
jgi:hypothetical protein